MTNRISKHITFAEGIKSQQATRLGISNMPTDEHLLNMHSVANLCFEPLREHFGVPIAVTSFYRSPAINKAIGGSMSSQHCKGQAMDLDADVFGGITNAQIFNWLKDNVVFDQLIWEFGDDKNPDWVHVSYNATGKNRKHVLKAVKAGDAIYYKEF